MLLTAHEQSYTLHRHCANIVSANVAYGLFRAVMRAQFVKHIAQPSIPSVQFAAAACIS